jgi:hypothetical protein
MKITRTPFRDIEKERWDLCLKFKFVECIAGFWRMTEKARKLYEPESFREYLKGTIEKPLRYDRQKLIKSLLEQ